MFDPQVDMCDDYGNRVEQTFFTGSLIHIQISFTSTDHVLPPMMEHTNCAPLHGLCILWTIMPVCMHICAEHTRKHAKKHEKQKLVNIFLNTAQKNGNKKHITISWYFFIIKNHELQIRVKNHRHPVIEQTVHLSYETFLSINFCLFNRAWKCCQ